MASAQKGPDLVSNFVLLSPKIVSNLCLGNYIKESTLKSAVIPVLDSPSH